MFGRLRSVEFCPQSADATLEAELFDGSEGVTLVWMGRRRIPGIEPFPTELPFLRMIWEAIDPTQIAAIFRETLIPAFFAVFGFLVPESIRAGYTFS